MFLPHWLLAIVENVTKISASVTLASTVIRSSPGFVCGVNARMAFASADLVFAPTLARGPLWIWRVSDFRPAGLTPKKRPCSPPFWFDAVCDSSQQGRLTWALSARSTMSLQPQTGCKRLARAMLKTAAGLSPATAAWNGRASNALASPLQFDFEAVAKTKTPTGIVIGYRSGFFINPFSSRSPACGSSPVSNIQAIRAGIKMLGYRRRLNRAQRDKRERTDHALTPLTCEHQFGSAVFVSLVAHVRLQKSPRCVGTAV